METPDKIQELQNEVKALEREVEQLKNLLFKKKKAMMKAINEDYPIKPGDVVNVYQYNYSAGAKKESLLGNGIFSHIAGRYGSLRFQVFKLKKDGTQSANYWPDWRISRIEKA